MKKIILEIFFTLLMIYIVFITFFEKPNLILSIIIVVVVKVFIEIFLRFYKKWKQ